jgi:hypothetical protein
VGVVTERKNQMHFRTIILAAVAVFAVVGISSLAQAAVIHNEAVNGDLTDFVEVDPWLTAGTSLGTLSVGENTILGNFGTWAGDDASDVFTFEIPVGFQLDSIDLTYIDNGASDGGSYMAIQGGTTLGTGMSTVGQNLSNALVDSSCDLLAMFEAGPAYGGIGLAGPLLAGDYTIGLHEIHSVIDYQMVFHMSPVPEPATIGMLACGGMGLLARRKRNG